MGRDQVRADRPDSRQASRNSRSAETHRDRWLNSKSRVLRDVWVRPPPPASPASIRDDAGLRLLGLAAPRNLWGPLKSLAQPARNPRPFRRRPATEKPSTPRRPLGHPTCTGGSRKATGGREDGYLQVVEDGGPDHVRASRLSAALVRHSPAQAGLEKNSFGPSGPSSRMKLTLSIAVLPSANTISPCATLVNTAVPPGAHCSR